MQATMNERTNRVVRPLVFALAMALLAFALLPSCRTTPEGGRVAPITPVLTIADDVQLSTVIADFRTNGDVIVLKAKGYARLELRDSYTGANLWPPLDTVPGGTYAWRITPRTSAEAGPDEPLPAWVGAAPGLWRVGEAEALGYTFAPPEV